MSMSYGDSSQTARPDQDVLEDIWAAVWQAGTLRSSEMGSISITVQQGEVSLGGHLAGQINRGRIDECARTVPGVTAVHNNLIVDRELALEVARALSEDERTRPYVIPVGSSHGWLRLGGEVSGREVQLAAEEVAGSVPHVRGVTALPRVTGAGPAPERRAVQPRSGASVYGNNGQVGVVAQVVMDPRNRLVTHVVVRANELLDEKRGPGDYLLPVEAFDVVNVASLFLAPGGSRGAAHPLFDPAAYPPAPSDWQPPYPYTNSSVRWPRRNPVPVANWPQTQPQSDRHVTEVSAAGRLHSGG